METNEVLRHHRPEWMDGLELALYLPGRKRAFEYQGQQHSQPIKAWGGEVALRDLQERNARKVLICSQAGVRLVVVAYTESLTDEHIRGAAQPLIAQQRPDSHSNERIEPCAASR